MSSRLCYFTVRVPDHERARAFFGGALGWEFATGNVPNGLHVTNATPPGGVHGGNDASGIDVFFAVDDLEATVARIRGLGGEAGEPEGSQAAGGRYVACRDDQGTRFWLYEPAAEAT